MLQAGVTSKCIKLYFYTSYEMRKSFENTVSKRFEVGLLRQEAHWYLQSRATQSVNHDITVDQSCCITLIILRFLPSIDANKLSNFQIKCYSSSLPLDFVSSNQEVFADKETVQNFEKSLVLNTQMLLVSSSIS